MKKTLIGLLTAALLVPAAVFATSYACVGFEECSTTGSTEQRIAALQAQIAQLTQLLVQLIAQKNSTPAPTTSTCFVPTYDLYIGRDDSQTNGEVKKLQLWLKAEGYFPDAQITGYYGEKTAAAVMKWQKAHGMDFVTLTSGVGKMTRAKMQEACGMKTVTQCGKYEDPPVISSISPSSGPVGTNITLQGCNFAGFESDRVIWFTNSQGVKGIYNAIAVDGKFDTSPSAHITLPSRLCQQMTWYSGLPCSAYLDLTPGTYSIYANSYGGNSNAVNFTVTASASQLPLNIKLVSLLSANANVFPVLKFKLEEVQKKGEWVAAIEVVNSTTKKIEYTSGNIGWNLLSVHSFDFNTLDAGNSWGPITSGTHFLRMKSSDGTLLGQSADFNIAKGVMGN